MLKSFPILLDQIRMTRELQTRLVQKECRLISSHDKYKKRSPFFYKERRTLVDRQAAAISYRVATR